MSKFYTQSQLQDPKSIISSIILIKNFDEFVLQYTDFWYEVARLPSQFQTGTKCDNATYTLNSNGTVTVFNQAITSQGQYTSIIGLATVIDPNVPASLRIVFGTGKRIPSFSNIY